ncbi:hypothetical protein [Flavitalea sp.]|nr:hypothetical protein [Flavitalea sp.]
MLENAIASLYQDGTISRHIKKTVRLYRERRDHFCDLLKNELGSNVSFQVPDGGMSVWLTFKNHNLPRLSADALLKGLVISTGEDYNTDTTKYNAARFGFASLNTSEQLTAIAILKKCMRI